MSCLSFLLRPGRGAEYCDQLICLSVCLSVREHISGTVGPIFTNLLCRSPVAVARASSGGVAIMGQSLIVPLEMKSMIAFNAIIIIITIY